MTRHCFYTTRPGKRFTLNTDARAEILERLLAPNRERHVQKVAAGLYAPTNGKAEPDKAKTPNDRADPGAELFGMDT